MNTDLTFHYPHPPTSEEAVAALEKELGYPLPEDYRNFLLKYNGGSRPTPKTFDYKSPNGKASRSSVEIFFGLDVEESKNIKVQQDADQPDYLFIIGGDLGGLLCIGINGDYQGKIYVWETTIGLDIILLANSFNEFLDKLYDDES